MTTEQEFNLATADKYQLKFYAKTELDLSLSLSMTVATMRERIQKHCVENEMSQPEARVEGTRKSKGSKYITINIAKTAGKDGAEPAFVGVQGVGYTVPRGIDVAVPAAVVEVLKNAKQDIITQDAETGEIHKEQVLTYAYQVVSGGN